MKKETLLHLVDILLTIIALIVPFGVICMWAYYYNRRNNTNISINTSVISNIIGKIIRFVRKTSP